MANGSVFELFAYLKRLFKDKTADISSVPERTAEKSKVRKGILRFISIFHPDK